MQRFAHRVVALGNQHRETRAWASVATGDLFHNFGSRIMPLKLVAVGASRITIRLPPSSSINSPLQDKPVPASPAGLTLPVRRGAYRCESKNQGADAAIAAASALIALPRSLTAPGRRFVVLHPKDVNVLEDPFNHAL